MPKYAFFPFIEPTHAGQIVFPDFDTMCTESPVKESEPESPVKESEPESPVKESEPESPVKERKINIDDLGIDFRKLEISGGRSGKLSNTYKHGELKTFCDILKRRGVTFDGCSKKELVDTILRLE
jgi:hypothetical protein